MFEARLRKHYHNLFPDSPKEYRNIIIGLYEILKESYCNEYVYKNTIINELFLKKYDPNQTTLLDEFSINKSVADLILLNGEPVLYEIKTALDNTERLRSQIEDYRKAVSKIYIVVSSKTASDVLEKYSSTKIGIYEFTEKHRLVMRQKAEEDNNYLNHLTLFKLLRKNEYLEVIRQYFEFVPEVPNTKIFKECLQLVSAVEVRELQNMVFSQLKKRKLKCPDRLQSEAIPYELKHLCYALNLSETQYNELDIFLNSKL